MRWITAALLSLFVFAAAHAQGVNYGHTITLTGGATGSGTSTINVTLVGPLPVGELTGTTLPSSVVSSSLTSLGTLTSLNVSGGVTTSGLSGGTCTNGLALNSSNQEITVACPGGAGSIAIGSTSVTGGSSGFILYDNAGTLGNLAVTGTGAVVLATSPSIATPTVTGLATHTGSIDIQTNAVLSEAPNAASTGTTLHSLAKLTGAPSTAVIAATTDTSGIFGVVMGGAGTSGNAQIAREGEATCTFDGATTSGDYVAISSTTGGDCHDTGASTYPTAGQVLGRVLSTNGSGGAYAMTVGAGAVAAAGGSTSFSAITNGTNTTASMLVGTGGSLMATGLGTITATTMPLSGLTGLGTGVATALAAAVNGTGSISLSTSPAFVTPVLGTPTSVTLTNATGLPAAGVLAGALANGMTATTQATADNTTKVATDAFVIANGGTTTITLATPGIGNSSSTYNPGTQTVTNGSSIFLQNPFYHANTTSCTVNSGCVGGSTNDSNYLLTPTAASVVYTAPNPTTVGGAVYNFGYDGTHTYSLTTAGGTATFYGACGAGATTFSSIAVPVTIVPDGTNYQCFPSGGTGAGSGTVNSGTALHATYYPATAAAVSSQSQWLYDSSGNLFGNFNAAAPTFPTTITHNGLFINGLDSQGTGIIVQANNNGTVGAPTYAGIGNAGTGASPAAVTSGNNLVIMAGYGYFDATNVSANAAQVDCKASQNWAGTGSSPTAEGTLCDFYTTANNTATLSANMRLDQNGALLLPASATNPGANGLAVTGPTSVAQAYSCINPLTDGATIALNAATCNNASVTIAGNRTLSNPTNMIAGQNLNFTVTQDATGGRTLAFGSDYVGSVALNSGTNGITTFSCSATSSSSCNLSGGALQLASPPAIGSTTPAAGSFTQLTSAPTTLTNAATIATNAALGNSYTLSMTTGSPGPTYTLANPTGLGTQSQLVSWKFIEDSTGGETISSYGTDFNFPAGTPVFNTTANAINVISCRFDAAVGTCFGGAATGSQLVGTTTNDNANAGNVGEYTSSDCTLNTAATVTITIATPAVITLTGHGITGSPAGSNNGGICPVVFATSGALPTGLTAATVYYTIGSSLTTNTFEVATSIANAIAGTAVAASGTQSGTQTATTAAPFATTNTPINATAVNLTAGDWNVCSETYFSAGASTLQTEGDAGITPTSVTLPTAPTGGYATTGTTAVGAGGVQPSLTTRCIRKSLATATTEYLVSNAKFTVSTDSAYGAISARRMR